MIKLRKFWHRIPAKIRAIFNILSIGVCLLALYISLDTPAFSVEQAFRRAEKANLAGPSEILAQVETAGTPYRHLVAARGTDSATIFTFSWWNDAVTDLLYIETEGDLTIAAAPDATYYPNSQKAVVPVILFDSVPEAVRAEVDLTLAAEYRGTPRSKTYQLSAEREYDGCFLFTIAVNGTNALNAEGQLLLTLQQIAGNSLADTVDTVIPAQVRLYDASGACIREETVRIRSAAAKARG